MTKSNNGPLRVGVGGPVGTGKTALMDAQYYRAVMQWRVLVKNLLEQGNRKCSVQLDTRYVYTTLYASCCT